MIKIVALLLKRQSQFNYIKKQNKFFISLIKKHRYSREIFFYVIRILRAYSLAIFMFVNPYLFKAVELYRASSLVKTCISIAYDARRRVASILEQIAKGRSAAV